jgi:hypothetical protein
MKKSKRVHRWKTTCSAIITMLALLIAPFCGPICAASSGCDHAAAISGSADTCHHSGVVTTSTSNNAAVSNARACNQHDLFVIVSAERTWPSPAASSTSAIPFQVAQTTHLDVVAPHAQWHSGSDLSKASLPGTSTSVLRI